MARKSGRVKFLTNLMSAIDLYFGDDDDDDDDEDDDDESDKYDEEPGNCLEMEEGVHLVTRTATAAAPSDLSGQTFLG